MPALPAAAGVVKVTLPFSVPSDPNCLNRFYIHYSGTAPTAAQLATFCDAVGTAWNTNIAPLCGTNVTQFAPLAEDLSSSTGATAQGTTSHNGTRAGTTLPGATCLMVQFNIARRYRGGKPKIFLPGGVAGDLANNLTWGPAFTATALTDFQAFITAVNAAGWAAAGTLTHVNVSYFSGFTVVTNPISHRAKNVPTLRGTPTVDTVISYTVEVGVASQRRRNVV